MAVPATPARSELLVEADDDAFSGLFIATEEQEVVPSPKKRGRKPGAKAKAKPAAESKAKVKKTKTKEEEERAKDKLAARKELASKSKRRCRGCRKGLAGTCFKYNEPFCHPCNATMESIRKISDRQGNGQWFREQRLTEETATPLINNFREHKKAVEQGERSDKWSTAEARETLAVTHETDFVDSGQLMDKMMYIS